MRVLPGSQNHGLINKAAYSLIIQHLDGSDGSLVIGGYDAAKVNGEINWTSIKNSNIHALLSEVKINGQTIPVNKQYTLDTGGGTGFYQRLHIIKLLLICPKIQNSELTVAKLPVHYLKVKLSLII